MRYVTISIFLVAALLSIAFYYYANAKKKVILVKSFLDQSVGYVYSKKGQGISRETEESIISFILQSDEAKKFQSLGAIRTAGGVIFDAWGTKIGVKIQGNNIFTMTSAGPDCKFDTSDDISSPPGLP